MAKITARGAHEVARWSLELDGREFGTALLRSDGVILRKSTIPGDRWTTWLRLKASVTKPISRQRAEAALMARGYTLGRR